MILTEVAHDSTISNIHMRVANTKMAMTRCCMTVSPSMPNASVGRLNKNSDTIVTIEISNSFLDADFWGFFFSFLLADVPQQDEILGKSWTYLKLLWVIDVFSKIHKVRVIQKCSTFIKSVRNKNAFVENYSQRYSNYYKTRICVHGDSVHWWFLTIKRVDLSYICKECFAKKVIKQWQMIIKVNNSDKILFDLALSLYLYYK